MDALDMRPLRDATWANCHLRIGPLRRQVLVESRRIGALAIGLLVIATGCDRTDQILEQEKSAFDSQTVLVSQTLSPRSTIDKCIAAYRGLSSYEDRAQVVLDYTLDGQQHEDRAPLSVAWNRDGRLGLRVYSIEAGPDSGRWRLRFNDIQSSSAQQVLSRAIPRELTLDWLLADPVVAERLSAGLAGFPPQLDLLISRHPLGGLIDDSATLSFERPQSIDGRACHAISIRRGRARYTLYIDQATMLLRRLRLPNLDLPPQLLSDRRVQDLNLTIEWENVQTNSDVNWKRFAVTPSNSDLLVTHFVSPPATVETDGLGKRVPAFRLHGPDGNEVYNSSDSDGRRKATVLMWLADHPGCRVAAAQLAETAQSLTRLGLSDAIDLVPLWAEPFPAAGETFKTLPQAWNLPGKLALDRNAMGRDLFQVREAPTLILLDRANRIQLRESKTNPLLSQILPDLLKQVAGGRDLAEETLQDVANLGNRHQAELLLARSLEASARHTPGRPTERPAAYAPMVADLISVAEFEHSAAVAAVVDSRFRTWILHTDGALTQIDDLLHARQTARNLKTSWQPQPDSLILISPEAGKIAMASGSHSKIEVLDVTDGQHRTFDLPNGDVPVDWKWMRLNGSKSPRLAVITSGDQAVLLDPRNQEQLSGRCPARPVALLRGGSKPHAVDGMVVLVDGSVQPIQLPAESAHNRVPLLGKPASHPTTDSDHSANPTSLSLAGFQPADGPWIRMKRKDRDYVLARGWLARDEPAVFLLDENLAPLWHQRTGLPNGNARRVRICATEDPTTGLATWIMVDADQTLYLMRSDGVTDHFRVDTRVVGLSLVASGNRLLLGIVHPNATQVYQVDWR